MPNRNIISLFGQVNGEVYEKRQKQGLGFQEGGIVRHEGGGVLEVNPVGQVSLLLLLLPPPENNSQ